MDDHENYQVKNKVIFHWGMVTRFIRECAQWELDNDQGLIMKILIVMFENFKG